MSDKIEETGDEEGQGDRKRKIIIGLVVVAVVAALVVPTILLTRGWTDQPAEVETLESLGAKVTAQELTVATQAETIANLRTDMNGLSAGVSCDCTDWTATIIEINGRLAVLEAALEDPAWAANITDLQTQIDELIASCPRYAMVTRVEDDYVDVTVYGNGDYPVALTLYGVGNHTVEARYPLLYTVVEAFFVSDHAGCFIIEPIAEWHTGDIIELKVTVGDVHYASAAVGEGAVGSTPGW